LTRTPRHASVFGSASERRPSGRQVLVEARAKVNLGLEVLGRRADGYHALSSLLWAIDLADRVTLEAASTGIAITCDAPDVPVTEDNLAWRAADLVRRETGTTGGVRIHIAKAIPVAAGLGGGSSDAAAVLVGLGRLWGIRLPRPRVQALATALGMDVPFFLGPSPALASGRGEVLHPLAMRQAIPLVVANPGVPLATREVYGALGPADFSDGGRVEALARAGRAGIAAVAAHLVNGLERAASRLWSGLGDVKAALLEAGCLGAVMSGSGPTVIGVAASAAAARRVVARLDERPWRFWVTRTVAGRALTATVTGPPALRRHADR
jgi:4-diphosphocytidyl-2-C-methyl-D-erythritol kinase